MPTTKQTLIIAALTALVCAAVYLLLDRSAVQEAEAKSREYTRITDSLRTELQHTKERTAGILWRHDTATAAAKKRDAQHVAEIARLRRQVAQSPKLARATAADLDSLTRHYQAPENDTMYCLSITRMRAVTSDALLTGHLQRLNSAQDERIASLDTELSRVYEVVSELKESAESERRVNEAIQAAQKDRIGAVESDLAREKGKKKVNAWLWRIGVPAGFVGGVLIAK